MNRKTWFLVAGLGWLLVGAEIVFSAKRFRVSLGDVAKEISQSPSSIAEKGRYQIVDLHDGTISYRNDPPLLGWTEEYKTSKLVLRRIKPGRFLMGSSEHEPDCSCAYPHEGQDRHLVVLTKPFYLSVFEVTQAQWKLMTGASPAKFAVNGRMPVEQVSYDDIRGGDQGSRWSLADTVDRDSFVGRLREKTGCDGFDLPTEAQWEYACRAGTTTPYCWGNVLNGDEATCDGRYPYGTNVEGRFRGMTDEVGTHAPNAFGLYDMHGNVEEWCIDGCGDFWPKETDPKGLQSGPFRVIRGGSWNHRACCCRSWVRDYANSDRRCASIGFRLACATEPQ